MDSYTNGFHGAGEAHDPEDGAKRRKLDELFADQPYLSPTMKARQLHEKLLETNRAPAHAPEPPREPRPEPRPEAREVRPPRPAPPPQPDRVDLGATAPAAPRPERPVRWADAAAFLRRRAGGPLGETGSTVEESALLSFRDRQLRVWLRDLGE